LLHTLRTVACLSRSLYHYGQGVVKMKLISKRNVYSSLALLMLAKIGFAETIVIYPNTVISYPKTYNNVTLDLTNGSFIIKNGASLTITNSNLIGTISPTNPVLITVDGGGSLVMDNDQVNVTSNNIPAHPKTQSLQYVIQVATAAAGGVKLMNNAFSMAEPFTAGLLITTSSIPTSGIQLTNNNITGFHGVFYLIASDNATVHNNTLIQNSYGNVVVVGNNDLITGNTIKFSGNDHLGNSIDVIDSDTVTISNNLLLTPTCHGIYVMNSDNLTIDSNQVFGGITYAMNIYSFPETAVGDEYITQLMSNHTFKNSISTNVTITNNFMSQNRYGIAASDVNTLTVQNNYFIQRFTDNASRKFWTNNNILLKNVTNLTWGNNLYKEAFSQDINGDNSKSFQIVTFPQSGGVSI